MWRRRRQRPLWQPERAPWAEEAEAEAEAEVEEEWQPPLFIPGARHHHSYPVPPPPDPPAPPDAPARDDGGGGGEEAAGAGRGQPDLVVRDGEDSDAEDDDEVEDAAESSGDDGGGCGDGDGVSERVGVGVDVLAAGDGAGACACKWRGRRSSPERVVRGVHLPSVAEPSPSPPPSPLAKERRSARPPTRQELAVMLQCLCPEAEEMWRRRRGGGSAGGGAGPGAGPGAGGACAQCAGAGDARQAAEGLCCWRWAHFDEEAVPVPAPGRDESGKQQWQRQEAEAEEEAEAEKARPPKARSLMGRFAAALARLWPARGGSGRAAAAAAQAQWEWDDGRDDLDGDYSAWDDVPSALRCQRSLSRLPGSGGGDASGARAQLMDDYAGGAAGAAARAAAGAEGLMQGVRFLLDDDGGGDRCY